MTWTVRKIGEFCKVGRGSSPRPKNDHRYFENGHIPWIKVADATASGKYLYETKEYVNEFGASFSRLLPAGALIICTSGTLGFPIFLGVEGCIHDGWLYTYHYSGLEPDFLYYFLQTKRSYFASVAYGAAIQNINTDILRNTPIALPPVNVQRQIVGLLRSYDDLIENNRRRMGLLEEAARLLYREWFVRLRFPGHEHTRITNGAPGGWERTAFENALVLQRGFDLPVQAREDGDVPVYGSTGINGFHNKARVTGPGLVTGRSGTLGEVHYIPGDFWPLNTALWVKEFRRVTPLFSLFLMREMDLKQYNGGVSVPTLDRKTVHKVEILLPPKNLLMIFDEFANPLFEQIGNLTLQDQKLRAVRDLLLPRLMSGEVAV